MKKKMNSKKGFTLIELLAVIVVLALIMILAIPSVLTTMNKAKMKTFQMMGENMVRNAMTTYEAQLLLNEAPTHKYGEKMCYTFADIGMTSSTGGYSGFVVIEPSTLIDSTSGGTQTQYSVYLTDKSYAYNGTASADVLNDTSKISTNSTDIDAVTAAKCQ